MITMIPNYELTFHVTTTGKLYDKEGKRVHSYLDVNGKHVTRLFIDGKPYQRRTQMIVATAYIPNPHDFPALFIKDEADPSAKWCFWCDHKYLKMAKKNAENGIETPPQVPEIKVKKKVVKKTPVSKQKRTFAKPPQSIACTMKW